MVALHVNEEALRGQIHPVPLSAMRYIRNRQGGPEEAWIDYYVTIVGFPEGRPLSFSSGRIKGEKGMIVFFGKSAADHNYDNIYIVVTSSCMHHY